MAFARTEHQLHSQTETPGRRGARLRWLAAEPFDWALSALYVSVVLGYIMRTLLPAGPPFSWPAMALVVGGAAVLVAVDHWEYWRYNIAPPARIAVALLVLRFVVIEAMHLADMEGASGFLYLVLPFSAALTLGLRAGWITGGLIWLLFLLHMGLPTAQWPYQSQVIENLLVFPAGIVFVLAMASVVSAERSGRQRSERLLEQLEHSHARLTEYAAQVEELTISAERSRLAREIHDSLGHYLAAINVQLRKTSAFRIKDPAQAELALHESTRLTHEALEDVRRSVGWLRRSDEPLSLERGLQELVAPFDGDALRVDVAITGSDAGFARSTLLALYRAAQEGLTNVRRHACASHVILRLHFTADEVLLTIRDDGAGFDTALLAALPAARTERYGLQGIRERLELVGGVAQITSVPGAGTTLTLRAPKQPPAERVRDQVRDVAPAPPGRLARLFGCEDHDA
jgi:signal transduction histidine kinase